jgi:Spy/CpxP family protein refolding chaperone
MRIPSMLLTAALLATSGAAIAQPGYGHHDNEFLQGVSLSDSQRDQVKQIEKAGWEQARGTFQQMRTIHEQVMARLLAPGSVSEADLTPLVQQEQALRAQLDEQRLAAALQMRQVLTPQQLAEAAAKHQQLDSLHDQERQVMQPSSAN